MSEDYAVKVTVRNGRILRRMRELGFNSMVELSEASAVSYHNLSRLVALRQAPLDANGEWTDVALNVAAVLRTSPEDLWSEAQQTMKLERNQTEVFMDEAQVAGILTGRDMSRAIEMKHDVLDAISYLTPEQQRVITGRFFDGATMAELGEEMGVSATRIQQHEARAIRQMKKKYFEGFKGYR